MASPQALPFHIALAGPTAAGKTAAALAIAKEYDCEIISVDSALVFRGMDIGTAKPHSAELAQVKHHLINIRDPLNAYSAAEFASDAQGLVHEISARGKLPLLVGGTMLYFKALREGIDPMPAANPGVRAAIEAGIDWAREGNYPLEAAIYCENAIVSGKGTFELNELATLGIGHPDGIFSNDEKELKNRCYPYKFRWFYFCLSRA